MGRTRGCQTARRSGWVLIWGSATAAQSGFSMLAERAVRECPSPTIAAPIRCMASLRPPSCWGNGSSPTIRAAMADCGHGVSIIRPSPNVATLRGSRRDAADPPPRLQQSEGLARWHPQWNQRKASAAYLNESTAPFNRRFYLFNAFG